MLHFNKLPAHIHTFSDPWKLTVTLKKELPWTMVWVILLISSGHISLRTVEWEITKQLSTTPLNCPQKPNMALWQQLYTETCHVEMKKEKEKKSCIWGAGTAQWYRVQDLWSKGCGIELWQKWQENFHLQGQLSVLINDSYFGSLFYPSLGLIYCSST